MKARAIALSLAICASGHSTAKIANVYHKDLRETPKIVFEPVFENKNALQGEALAKDYLKSHADLYKLPADLGNLKLQRVKESLLAKHFHFQQVLDGIPVKHAEIIVSLSLENSQIIKVFNNTFPMSGPLPSKKTVDTSRQQAEKALDAAWANLKVRGKLMAMPKAEPFYVFDNGAPRLIFETNIDVTYPYGSWTHQVDASTGKILKIESNDLSRTKAQLDRVPNSLLSGGKIVSREAAEDAFYQESPVAAFAFMGGDIFKSNPEQGDGEGVVFDPDPRTALADMSLVDTTAAEKFEDAYSTIVLKDLAIKDGEYHLTGPWVKVEDFDPPKNKPSTRKDGKWADKRGNNSFNDAMTYFHVDQSQRYMQELGFTDDKGIQFGPIGVDTDGVNGDDNSYFRSSSNVMSFGHGCVDDNEDADVILHEYGHAIQHSINTNWYGGDTGAMGEGFGDYWAGSYSISTSNGRDFHPEKVFTWDGHSSCWGGRRLDKTDARYNPDQQYYAHSRLNGFVSDELWSTPLFQALMEITERGHPREDVDKIVLESHFGLGASMTMRGMAKATLLASSKLYPNMPYTRVFEKHFRHHNILQPVITMKTPKVIDSGDNGRADPGETLKITIPLVNDGLGALKDVKAVLSSKEGLVRIIKGEIAYSDIPVGGTVANTEAFEVEINSALACGNEIPFELVVSYTEGKAMTYSGEFSIATGTPVVNRIAVKADVAIPDDDMRGVMSVIEVADATTKVGGQFSVDVDITHPVTSDLRVTLIAPNSRRVVLWDKRWESADNIVGNFPETISSDESLDAFSGVSVSGKWRLHVSDFFEQDAGHLNEWAINAVTGFQCQ